MIEDYKKLNRLKGALQFRGVPSNDEWKDWRIACVDGSDSPQVSERVGLRYGVYAAGYMIFQEGNLEGEDYFSGGFFHEQAGDPESTEKLLRLLTTKLEREVALLCLKEKGADLILIDGSFFGFRAGCSSIRNKTLNHGPYSKASELIDEVRDLTIDLLESRRAVGIVKRVRTSAIDGWVASRWGLKSCLDRNDRSILASIMPEAKWFDYGSLLGSQEAAHYYNLLKAVMREEGLDADRALREARRLFEEGVKENLGCPPDPILKAYRYFHRPCAKALPFCFEAHKEARLEPILAYFQAKPNFNEATGLPFPIDLIDENVTLPRRFAKEFVEEIEALLMKDPRLDKVDLSNNFLGVNPQKEE